MNRQHKIDPLFDNDECRKNWSEAALAAVRVRAIYAERLFWMARARHCQDGQQLALLLTGWGEYGLS